MASVSKRATAQRRDGRSVYRYDVRWRASGKLRRRTFTMGELKRYAP